MQITINQVEIEAAIKAHILNQINVKEGHKLAIEMKAGRGADGYTATIDISPENETKAAAAPQPTEPKQATAPKAEVAEQKQTQQKAPEPVAEEVQAEVVQQEAAPKAETEKMSLFGDLPKVSDTNK
ncbi:hypothetical protein PP742_gp26 [Alcaligenes phage vB_Af_QDWS595]|uniref:Uncharacterized protein n=1 Tax=Alcaligenes phage vB_Af_QDWS595 TaxID=2877946 RepID=A0AAE9BZH5_9CAUD|nr:hypothetical protein PP742_gp26 [Alcaligenes phage vB_Af_QDWS595]UCR75510.1 hypothetical protein vBAfaPQDWS595_26 [Alcaligenes phage vB_Af_QDWS595]